MSTPKNWPPTLPYLRSPLHDGLTATQTRILRENPKHEPDSDGSPRPALRPIIISASETSIPPRNIRIQPITEPRHPAHGQHGLFATRHLAPGQFILAYLGRVHGSGSTDPGSDYDLWLDKEADLAVDAARAGNEARFVNDFRGVRERPNAVFGTAWCERWGEVCVGVWVVGGRDGDRSKDKSKSKSGSKDKDKTNTKVKARAGIRKGEEIVVSYGKGFWGQRQGEGMNGGW
ncbi:hypothetical protein E4U21_000373 [Claviceps maximensis]|nr:hypothetical protein E4U21_000373 [Claviceps maximensis]